MSDLQAQYDDAMFAFSQGDYDTAILGLNAILAADPAHFDAQLSLGMAHCRKGDFATAIAEGHKAERLRPHEQLVHTNLSLFYMRAGNKVTAEHHGLQARIASWKGNMTPPGAAPDAPADPELQLAQPKPQSFKLPEKFPDQPWKKNKPPA
jgi:Tfp pilus assembly protein PilF